MYFRFYAINWMNKKNNYQWMLAVSNYVSRFYDCVKIYDYRRWNKAIAATKLEFFFNIFIT